MPSTDKICSVRVSEEMYEGLKDDAVKNHRSLSQEITYILERGSVSAGLEISGALARKPVSTAEATR